MDNWPASDRSNTDLYSSFNAGDPVFPIQWDSLWEEEEESSDASVEPNVKDEDPEDGLGLPQAEVAQASEVIEENGGKRQREEERQESERPERHAKKARMTRRKRGRMVGEPRRSRRIQDLPPEV